MTFGLLGCGAADRRLSGSRPRNSSKVPAVLTWKVRVRVSRSMAVRVSAAAAEPGVVVCRWSTRPLVPMEWMTRSMDMSFMLARKVAMLAVEVMSRMWWTGGVEEEGTLRAKGNGF